jgi:hypothetical protein
MKCCYTLNYVQFHDAFTFSSLFLVTSKYVIVDVTVNTS